MKQVSNEKKQEKKPRKAREEECTVFEALWSMHKLYIFLNCVLDFFLTQVRTQVSARAENTHLWSKCVIWPVFVLRPLVSICQRFRQKGPDSGDRILWSTGQETTLQLRHRTRFLFLDSANCGGHLVIGTWGGGWWNPNPVWWFLSFHNSVGQNDSSGARREGKIKVCIPPIKHIKGANVSLANGH